MCAFFILVTIPQFSVLLKTVQAKVKRRIAVDGEMLL